VKKRHLLVMTAIAALAIVIAFSTATAPPPDAYAETTDPDGATGTLTVSAQGKIAASPDIVYLQLGTETEKDTAQRAITANSNRMRDVVSRLKALGIDEKDIQTSRFSVSSVYDRTRNNERELVGFRAENRITVVVRDVEQTGRLIDEAVEAGANQVHNVTFQIADKSQLEDQAMRLAIQRAKSKAQVAAEESGVQIVGTEEINISSGRTPVPSRVAMEYAQEADTPIMSGEITVSVEVSVVFRTSD